MAAYCCRLLEMAVEHDHPVPELHDLLRRALDHVAVAGASVRALRHYERELGRLLGVADNRSGGGGAGLASALGGLPALRGEVLGFLAGNDRGLDSSSSGPQ